MTEQDALDSGDLEVEPRDVLAEPGEEIDNIDGVAVRNIFDDSDRVASTEPTKEADWREDFPEKAPPGEPLEAQPDGVG